MVFYRLGDIYHLQVNYESAEQLASFLKDNIHKPAWGYTAGAFVGYPARQFIIVAIPSLLFGNEVFWLQFGYAILFYSGVLSFFLGVRHYFSIKQHGELWALFTVRSCFTFPYLIRYLYNLEQIILPVAFVMHALGWFLLSLERLTAGSALIVAWITGLLGTSYTPALAAWILFQTFFLLLLLRAARPRASSANRFVGFRLGLYVDIRPLLLSHSHRCPFNTTTRAFYRVSAHRPESVLSGPSGKVYASCGCYSRRYFFLVSSNRTPGVYQMDYCRVVAGCDLFFSDLRGICAVSPGVTVVPINIADSRYDACLLGHLPRLRQEIQTMETHWANSCRYLMPGYRCGYYSSLFRSAYKL